jgi:hypothetical protein
MSRRSRCVGLGVSLPGLSASRISGHRREWRDLRLKRNYTDGQLGCYVRSHSKTARELIAFIANSAHALWPTSAQPALAANYAQTCGVRVSRR